LPTPVWRKLAIGRLAIGCAWPSRIRQLPNPFAAMSFESASMRVELILSPPALSAIQE
jgi:hypothetical protein